MAKQKPCLNQADINLLKKSFATKKYLDKKLSNYPTKKYLDKNFATKKDLKNLEQRVVNTFVTKDEFENSNDKFFKALEKHRSDLMTTLDKILKEILASREAQKILNERTSDNKERITSLENIHPQGKHAFA